jgi:hypothetical protein
MLCQRLERSCKRNQLLYDTISGQKEKKKKRLKKLNKIFLRDLDRVPPPNRSEGHEE